MADRAKTRWSEYYEITKNKPPSELLVKAIGFLDSKDNALDLGAGALKDTGFLLQNGFKVTAIDSEPAMIQVAAEINNDNLKTVTSSFEDSDYPKQSYDLINAQYALPFNSPHTFNEVWNKIKNSLKSNGIFTGQFFGNNDEWNITGTNMTFKTESEVRDLLSGMEVIELTEEDKDSTTANGKPKHWHIFHVIAKKR